MGERGGKEIVPTAKRMKISPDAVGAVGSPCDGARKAYALQNELRNWSRRRGQGVDDGVMSSNIVTDPEICSGRPTIRNTRMRVADILDLLASGADRAEILADYDYLFDEDISAALAYAARATEHRIVTAL